MSSRSDPNFVQDVTTTTTTPKVSWPIDNQHFVATGVRLDLEANGGEYDFQSDTFDQFNYMAALLGIVRTNFPELIHDNVSEALLDSPFVQQLPSWCEVYQTHSVRENGDSDRRKWLTVERFLDMGARLDAEHQGNDGIYNEDSELFLIVDWMIWELHYYGTEPLMWIEDEAEAMHDSRFLQRLATWCEVYHPTILEPHFPDPIISLHEFQWPESYEGPRTFAAAFMRTVYQSHSEAACAAQEFSQSNCRVLRSFDKLIMFLNKLELERLPQLLTNYLNQVQGHLDDLQIPQDVIDSPGIFQILLKGQYMEPDHMLNLFPGYSLVLQEIIKAVLRHYFTSSIFWLLTPLPTVMLYILRIPLDLDRFSPLLRDSMRHDEAVSFVNALPSPEITSIPREDMRCPHCWADFDEEVDGYNNEPKRVPCCRKYFGKDCLVKSMEDNGTKCPHCRQQLVKYPAIPCHTV